MARATMVISFLLKKLKINKTCDKFPKVMYVKNPVNLAFHTHIKPAEESNMNGEELS
jgi:hypothetical protein